MAEKKITIKDVAREAGVSVATVSYVINNRTDIKISDETRKRVLQIINLLNYSPNQAAKALATSKTNQLAFCVKNSNSILELATQMEIMKHLSHFFHSKKYDLFLTTSDCIEKYSQSNALICFDLPSKEFKILADSNYIPLIGLDCFINDPLFFQVNTNNNLLKENAFIHFNSNNYLYVELTPDNAERKDTLDNIFRDNIFYIADISDLKKIRHQNILVTNPLLVPYLKNKNIYLVDNINTPKFNQLFSCFEKSINRIPIENHNILV